jgi:hypothetical protein
VNLAKDVFFVLGVLEHRTGQDGIKGIVLGGQAVRRGRNVEQIFATPKSCNEFPTVATPRIKPRSAQMRNHLTGATAEIEDSRARPSATQITQRSRNGLRLRDVAAIVHFGSPLLNAVISFPTRGTSSFIPTPLSMELEYAMTGHTARYPLQEGFRPGLELRCGTRRRFVSSLDTSTPVRP